jgi:hypothetical protein
MHIDRNPSKRQLIIFSLLWFLVLGANGILIGLKTGMNLTSVVLGTAAVLVPGLGVFGTGFLRKVYVFSLYATYPIGVTVSFVILAIIYYGVMTPAGLVLRLAGHDPLQRRPDRSKKTYWMPRKSEKEIERYFQQF